MDQHHAYDAFLSWCRDKMKNMNTLKPVQIQLLYLFITGAGVQEKSFN